MGFPVLQGAMLSCPFGIAPSSLNVIPKGPPVQVEGKFAATIMDFAPFANISPFGTCSSLANPTTASLTAAALGVLTPGPCTPVTTPWKPGSSKVMINGLPALTDSSTCTCGYGGNISILFGGATRVMIN